MSRKFILIPSVLVFALFILFLFSGFDQLAHSDISTEQATKIYKVPFNEWVHVMLHVNVAVSAEDYSVRTSMKMINKRTRFIVTGSASNTTVGRKWYKEMVPLIEKAIEQLCEIWTAEGYPISLNDFEINIEAPY
jgi:hypothetical protein